MRALVLLLLLPTFAIAAGEDLSEVTTGPVVVDLEEGLPPYSPWSGDGAGVWAAGETAWQAEPLSGRFGFAYRSDEDHELALSGGSPGGLRFELSYDRFTVHDLQGETPYRGVESDTLTLPGGWVPATTPDGMSALPTLLHDLDIERRHTHVGAAVNAPAGPRWRYSLRFDHRVTEGAIATGAVIGSAFASARVAILPAPVEYRTDTYELAAAYGRPRYDLRFALDGSAFRNAHRALTWENAYDTASSVPQGQLALAPDNLFHQASAEGVYRFGSETRGSFRFAYGQMLQNESFLPYTVNDSLTTTALPRDSLEGRVDTWNVDLKLLSRLGERVTGELAFKYEELENLTPKDLYDYVINDTQLSPTQRESLPYSYRRQRLAGTVSRRAAAGRVQGGLRHQREARSFQEAERLTENEGWIELVHPVGASRLTLHAARSGRDGEYEPIAGVSPAENPLMRKYNLAARTGNRLRLRGDTWWGRFDLGAEAAYADFDYSESEVGLQGSVERQLSLDGGYAVDTTTSISVFVALQRVAFTQEGSTAFAAADWQARGEDTTRSVGLTANYTPPLRPYELRLDTTWTRTESGIRVDDADYPTLSGNLLTASLTAGYRLSPSTRLILRLAADRFEEDDWSAEGVDPDTIDHILALGEGDGDYRALATSVLLQHRF